MRLAKISVGLFFAGFQVVTASDGGCSWSDTRGGIRIDAGHCTFADLSVSGTIEIADRVAMVTATIRIGRDAALTIDDADLDELRLLSTPTTNAHLIAEAGTLRIRDVVIESYDPQTGGPDTDMSDGRAFLRVDGYVDENGLAANGRLEIDRSRLSYLGYDSRLADTSEFSGYGISLKVRSEEELRTATVVGHIRNSILSHNYRGFYSYGASDFEISGSEVHHNVDYGIDGHDDTDRLIAIGNRIYSNGGTGLICSRRCTDNVFENNDVFENGANGIVLHDVSTGGRILGNRVYENAQDGIVVHDSQDTLVAGNQIRENRYGLRIFSGSVMTTVTGNLFGANHLADIFVKHGNLESETDLSDFSHGPDWNAQNIARHNSSRVWATEIVGNAFEQPVTVLVRGANYLDFAENTYAAGVTFDIRSSDNIGLDGQQSAGPVRYLLRGEPSLGASYRLAAPAGSELSMTGADHVTLTGHELLIPEGGDFVLRIEAEGTDQLTLDVPRREDVRTAMLVDLPVTPRSGTAWITGYQDSFSIDRAISMEIRTPLDSDFRLQAFERLCRIVEWSLNGSVFISTGDEIVDLSSVRDRELTLTCLTARPG